MSFEDQFRLRTTAQISPLILLRSLEVDLKPCHGDDVATTVLTDNSLSSRS